MVGSNTIGTGSPGLIGFDQYLAQLQNPQLRDQALAGVDQTLNQALASNDPQQLQQVLGQMRQMQMSDLMLLLAAQDPGTQAKLANALGVAAPAQNQAQLNNYIGGLSPEDLMALAQLWQRKNAGQGGPTGPAQQGWANNGTPNFRQQLGDRIRGVEGPAKTYDTSNVQMPGGTMGKLLNAVSGQESGGKYGIVNPHSGALGKYQVMPANVASWSKEALGQSITPQQFLASPDLQEKIVGHRMEQYYKQGMAATGSEEGAVRFAASKWYSGRGEKWNDTTPQSYNGHSYPSIASYTSSVYQRFLHS